MLPPPSNEDPLAWRMQLYKLPSTGDDGDDLRMHLRTFRLGAEGTKLKWSSLFKRSKNCQVRLSDLAMIERGEQSSAFARCTHGANAHSIPHSFRSAATTPSSSKNSPSHSNSSSPASSSVITPSSSSPFSHTTITLVQRGGGRLDLIAKSAGDADLFCRRLTTAVEILRSKDSFFFNNSSTSTLSSCVTDIHNQTYSPLSPLPRPLSQDKAATIVQRWYRKNSTELGKSPLPMPDTSRSKIIQGNQGNSDLKTSKNDEREKGGGGAGRGVLLSFPSGNIEGGEANFISEPPPSPAVSSARVTMETEMEEIQNLEKKLSVLAQLVEGREAKRQILSNQLSTLESISHKTSTLAKIIESLEGKEERLENSSKNVAKTREMTEAQLLAMNDRLQSLSVKQSSNLEEKADYEAILHDIETLVDSLPRRRGKMVYFDILVGIVIFLILVAILVFFIPRAVTFYQKSEISRDKIEQYLNHSAQQLSKFYSQANSFIQAEIRPRIRETIKIMTN